ncbi:hypothetical protein ADK17_17285 [Bacillus anthracis]|nr:hypothetical protein ADK17_17285 [Bacillus anthracis]
MTNDKPHSEQEDYKDLLQEALHQRPASLPDGKQEQVLKIGTRRARITNVLIVFNFFITDSTYYIYIYALILCICTYKRNGDTECSKTNDKCNGTKCIYERKRHGANIVTA